MIRNTVTAFFIMLILTVGVLAGMPTDKDNMFIAGGLSFIKSDGDLHKNDNGDTPTVFSIHPEIYYFLKDRAAIGGSFEYTYYSQGNDYSLTNFGLGLGVKCYFKMPQQTAGAKNNLLPYMSYRIMYVIEKIEEGHYRPKLKGFNIDLAVGGVYMLSDCVGAFGEFDFSVNYRAPKGGDAITGTQFGFLIGITYFIVK